MHTSQRSDSEFNGIELKKDTMKETIAVEVADHQIRLTTLPCRILHSIVGPQKHIS